MSEERKEGYLLKRAGKGEFHWNRRWVVLEGNKLSYFEQKDSPSPKRSIVVPDKVYASPKVADQPPQRHIFAVKTIQKTYFFAGGSDEEANAWADAIRALMPSKKSGYQGIPKTLPQAPVKDSAPSSNYGILPKISKTKHTSSPPPSPMRPRGSSGGYQSIPKKPINGESLSSPSLPTPQSSSPIPTPSSSNYTDIPSDGSPSSSTFFPSKSLGSSVGSTRGSTDSIGGSPGSIKNSPSPRGSHQGPGKSLGTPVDELRGSSSSLSSSFFSSERSSSDSMDIPLDILNFQGMGATETYENPRVIQLLHDYPELLSEGRRFVRGGTFDVAAKESSKDKTRLLLPWNQSKSFFVFLFTDSIILTLHKVTKEGETFRLKTNIPLNHSRLILYADDNTNHHAFQVLHANVTYTFTPGDNSLATRNLWFADVKKLVKEFQKNNLRGSVDKVDSPEPKRGLSPGSRLSSLNLDNHRRLKEILADKDLALYFREFLHLHYNNENLSFWLEVEEFANGTNEEETVKRAHEIYMTYFSPASELELNINGPLRKSLEKGMISPTRKVFEEIQKSIWDLMAIDCIPKFLRSETYQNYKADKGFTPVLEKRHTTRLLSHFSERQHPTGNP